MKEKYNFIRRTIYACMGLIMRQLIISIGGKLRKTIKIYFGKII